MAKKGCPLLHPFVEGKPCRVCAGTLRYGGKGFNCVACSRERSRSHVKNRSLEVIREDLRRQFHAMAYRWDALLKSERNLT